MPRLSEMPDFLPLGKKGSPERRACALGTCANDEANADYIRFLIREYRLTQPSLTHLSTQYLNSNPETMAVREGAGNGT